MTRKDSKYIDKLTKDIQVRKEIINLLKANGNRMEEKKVLDLLGIARHDIPWGHNIGWARCSQVGGSYHLILQEYEMELIKEQKENSTVRLPITKEYELSIINNYIIDSPILEVALFVNGSLYGEPILDITWQYLIELMLQVSRGELSEFMDYEFDAMSSRMN
jgi:hypothetical protein